MNFIIFILVLILFNILVFMFTDDFISNKIISKFDDSNDNSCKIKNMILKAPHSNLECRNRCEVLKREYNYEGTKNCDCEELCIDTALSDLQKYEMTPVVSYTQNGPNSINVKWIPDSFIDNMTLIDYDSLYSEIDNFKDNYKTYFLSKDIRIIPLLKKTYIDYIENPTNETFKNRLLHFKK